MFEKLEHEETKKGPTLSKDEEISQVIAEIAQVPGREKLAAALNYTKHLTPAEKYDQPTIELFSNREAAEELWRMIGEAVTGGAPLGVVAATINIFARAAYWEGVKAGRGEQSEPQPENLQTTEAKA